MIRLRLALLIAALATPLAAQTPSPAAATPSATGASAAAERSHIDLVLCLDTSGSMDGLIESAKAKLWDVVNTLATAEPTPELRVALYSFGNDGIPAETGWVRRELALTDDLDAVNEKLFALRTNGGTELVARVTKTALEQETWTASPDRALRLIFVCGNEAATQDTVVTLEQAMGAAAERRVTVNTIYCGNPDNDEANGWRRAATLGKGRFASIDMNNTVAITTPFDDELAQLSSSLNSTYVAYGRQAPAAAARQATQDANAAKMSLSVAASRAMAKSSELYDNAGWDVVDARKKGMKLEEMPEAELPKELRELKPEEREAWVAKKEKERAELQAKIREVGAKREQFLRAERAKKAGEGAASLGDAIRSALTEQAASSGIVLKGS